MDVAQSLHPLERKVLPLLSSPKTVDELCSSGLQHVEVMRAVQWLEAKNLVSTETKEEKTVVLTEKGLKIKELPEKVVLRLVLAKPQKLSELSLVDGAGAALGVLRSRGFVVVKEGVVEAAGSAVDAHFPEESFLKRLPFLPVSKEDKEVALSLRRRGLVEESVKKNIKVFVTELGRKVLKQGFADFADSVTVEMLRDGSWKGKEFRSYDVKGIVPRLNAGKLQPYRRFLDSVRSLFVSMGFKEMSGPVVESDFWDMDALFMPQFHSARDIHEAYYVKGLPPAKVDSSLLKRVQEAHEKGVSGSSGWQYKFDSVRSCRQLLRTQATACSARMLASKDLEVPGKYFAIARCFRYDVIDATHLPDFHQVEGIVVGEKLTLRHLFGLLEDFARVIAKAEEVRIVPGYFPFTEPSAELFAKHPVLGWIELGGAGIFRPEVVGPLAQKDVSVIAWGLGVDRLGMFGLGIKDIRSLFSRDIAFLRGAKVVCRQ